MSLHQPTKCIIVQYCRLGYEVVEYSALTVSNT